MKKKTVVKNDHFVWMIAVSLLLMTGCTVTQAGVHVSSEPSGTYTTQKGGPPPHAPAHGYRAKHHGHNMRYDSGTGVYAVISYADTYFFNNLYFKMDSSGRWMVSSALDRGWTYGRDYQVPKKLKDKYKKKDKHHKHKKK